MALLLKRSCVCRLHFLASDLLEFICKSWYMSFLCIPMQVSELEIKETEWYFFHSGWEGLEPQNRGALYFEVALISSSEVVSIFAFGWSNVMHIIQNRMFVFYSKSKLRIFFFQIAVIVLIFSRFYFLEMFFLSERQNHFYKITVRTNHSEFNHFNVLNSGLLSNVT